MPRRSIVLTYPYDLGVEGGSAHDCARTALHLRRAGADVTLACITTLPRTQEGWIRASVPTGERGDERERELRDAGVEIVRVPPHPIHPWLDSLRLRRVLHPRFARREVDTVLGYWQEAAALPGEAARAGASFGMIAAAPYHDFLRAPRQDVADLLREPRGRRSAWHFSTSFAHRAVFRNQLVRAVPEGLRDLVFERPLRRAAHVFARSADVRRVLQEEFGVQGSRIRVVPCGIDPEWFGVERTPPSPLERIVFVGAVTRDKGLFDAFLALGRLPRGDDVRWTLRVVGPGDAGPAQAAARDAGIRGRVECLGPLSPDALREQLAWAQLALMPSHFESFGLAIAEAQAAGLPVVAWNIGAVGEIVEDGRTGLLAPFGRIDTLSQALGWCLENPERAHAMGLEGRRRAEARFSWERGAEQILAALEEPPTRSGG